MNRILLSLALSLGVASAVEGTSIVNKPIPPDSPGAQIDPSVNYKTNTSQCDNRPKLCEKCDEKTGEWKPVDIPSTAFCPFCPVCSNGTSSPNSQKSSSGADTSTGNHSHSAIDYSSSNSGKSSGCGSCGSSGAGSSKMTPPGSFALTRSHRFREVAFASNFGPGVFSGLDSHLALTMANDGATKLKSIEMFDPAALNLARYVEDPLVPGRFTDGIYNQHREIRLLTTFDFQTKTGQPVSAGYNFRSARYAQVTRHDGARLVFEVVQTESDPSPLVERMNVGAPETTLTSLPSGPITGFGIYSAGTSCNLRFDNFTITAIDGSVLYRETFPMNTTNPSTLAPSIEGWYGGRGDYATTTYLQEFSGTDVDPSLTNVGNTPVQSGQGYLAWTSKVKNIFMYTHELQNIASSNLGSIRLHTRHSAVVAPTFPALCIGGNWYVPADAQSFKQNVANVWEFKTLNIAGVQWRKLPIDMILDNDQLTGRMVSMIDATGDSSLITYKFTDDATHAYGDRLMQIDTVTDRYGNSAVFNYKSEQVGGRWVVESVVTPKQTPIQYFYTDGFLSSVSHPDGTQSKFIKGFDAARSLVTMEYHDPSAQGEARREAVYLTTTYSATSTMAVASVQPGSYLPASSQLTRMMRNGNGEVTYARFAKGYGYYI